MGGIQDSNSLSFGKLGNIDFSKFNGIQKSDFSEQNKEITDSVFKRYDTNNDGILEENELAQMVSDLDVMAGKNAKMGKREAASYMEMIGIKGGTREDLYNFLSEISADEDSVIGAEFNNSNKHTYIKYKADNSSNLPYTIHYDDNGNPIERMTTNGAVTTYYEVDGEHRPIKKLVNKGSDNIESSEIRYEGDLTIEAKYNANGEYIGSVDTHKDGTIVTRYVNYQNGESVSERYTTKRPDGTESIRVINYNGKYSQIIENSGPVEEDGRRHYDWSATRKVQSGDTWYSIVQEHYGISDSKEIQTVVKILKQQAGIKGSSKKMPSEINLPGRIQLEDGKVIAAEEMI